MIKTKKKYRQKGGVEPLSTTGWVLKLILPFIVGIVLKLLIGLHNLKHAKMYPNEIIEENNKKINENYLSCIEYRKISIKLLEECIEDKKTALYYVGNDKTKNKKDLEGLTILYIQQIKEYEEKIKDNVKLLKSVLNDYAEFERNNIIELEKVNQRLDLMRENNNLGTLINKESKKTGISKWLSSSNFNKELEKQYTKIKYLDPKKIKEFSMNIGLDDSNFKERKTEYYSKNIRKSKIEIIYEEIINEFNKFKKISILNLIDLLESDSIKCDIKKDDINNSLSDLKDTEIHAKLIELCIEKNFKKINKEGGGLLKKTKKKKKKIKKKTFKKEYKSKSGIKTRKKRKRTKRHKQEGGEILIGIWLGSMAMGLVTSLALKIGMGIVSLYWNKIYPNDQIELNNRAITGNYLSAINYKKQSIKFLNECIEDNNRSLYYNEKDKTKSKEDLEKIKNVFNSQIKDYQARINGEIDLLKEKNESYEIFLKEEMRKQNDINKRFNLLKINDNINEYIKKESKESSFSKWLNKSDFNKELDKIYTKINNLRPSGILKFANNIGIKTIDIEIIEEENFTKKKNVSRQKIISELIIEELTKLKRISILSLIDMLIDKESIINLDITKDDISNILSNVQNTEIHVKLIKLYINKNIEIINKFDFT